MQKYDLVRLMLNKGIVNSSILPEFIAVLNDEKPVLRSDIKLKGFSLLRRYCSKFNLKVSHSEFAISVKNEIPIKKPIEYSSNPLVHCYISKSDSIIKSAKFADKSGDYSKLGEILGYPKCCIDYSYKLIEENNRKGINQVTTPNPKQTYENTKSDNISFYNNYLFAPFLCHLIFHFPCSFDCKESIKIGKKVFRLVNEFDYSLAKKFKKILKSRVLYLNDHEPLKFEGSDFQFILFENSMIDKTNNEVRYPKIFLPNILHRDFNVKALELQEVLKIKPLFRYLLKSNRIRISNTRINLFDDNSFIKSFETDYSNQFIFLDFN